MPSKSSEPTALKGWQYHGTGQNTLADCSLILATYNRAAELQELLNALLSLPDTPWEVVIVDGYPQGSSSETWAEWCRAHCPEFCLRYIESPTGLTRQRNVGIDLSAGKFVFFLDDDCLPQPNYFSAIFTVFQEDTEQKIGAVSGSPVNEMNRPPLLSMRLRIRLRLVPRNAVPDLFYCTATSVSRSLQKPFAGMRSVDTLPGCSMAFRREVLEQERFSLFFAGYSQGEDLEMARRVARNWQLKQSGDAHVIHNHAQGGRPAGFLRGKMVARNRIFIWRRHIAPPRFGCGLKLAADLLFSVFYAWISNLRHPWKMTAWVYGIGLIVGSWTEWVRPSSFTEPTAQREYTAELRNIE